MMEVTGPIGVLGAGSWGTTLAQVLAQKGHDVDLWVFEKDLCETIKEKRENTVYLPGYALSERITAHHELEGAVAGHSLLVMVVPSHVYRRVVKDILPHMAESTIVVNATKGIENETLLTMWGIWRELMPHPQFAHYLCLSGPSFAKEVIREAPTAVTLAGEDLDLAKRMQQVFSTRNFRLYTSLDIMGVELAGALKNVIALAAGACDGLNFGYNTRAALITRGLAEISRLGVAMGANPLTFSGLAGIGDLILTCTGDLSRNRTVGKKLGLGMKIEQILGDMKMVAEGVKTARSVYHLSKKLDVDMPICSRVYEVIYENKDPQAAVSELLERDLKHELEWD